MAERHPREETLRRVHGVGALFSAAYGNVGSSIYYALGVTAAFALGLTPVAFVIAGLIFAATAATYAEATVMFPEAGGSSSFARHAFNELISFFAAWGQMLNYIITVAISAFFVPHYLAVFWSPLGHSPGDILGGIGVIAFLAAINIKGTQESTRLNLFLAIADLFTQIILVAIGILLIATNAGLIGVSRLTFSMGHYRQLPERLRQIHPRFRTPYVAILVFSLIAAITLIPGETKLLATLYSFGAMLSFTVAHISVIKLRQRYPDKEREWKPPGSVRAFGFDLPLTAVFGGLGTFAAWIVVMALNPRTLVIGAIWMALGTTIYLLYRRSLGLSPSQTHKVLLPEPLGVEEIEYKSVLIAFENDEPFNEQTMVTAVKLAGKKRRAVHVIAIVTVPNHLPLDAGLGAQEEEAQSKIEQAKLIGGLRVSGHIHRVRPNQAGHSIAEEARELKASALVMGLRYRDGAPLYGKTLQTLMAERPCRVIVVGEPERAREAAGMGPPVAP